jgi:hypothetical protein
MMLRRTCLSLLLFGVVAFLASQETAPSDPGIVLPPVLLEVEDLQVEDVNAALPADEDQLRPDVSIPLPEADDLYLPDVVFDIPYPDQIGLGSGGGQAAFTEYLQNRSQIFSDGQIGVGAPVHVLGDLTLYKLGDDPAFSLRFVHEKLDGYGFRPVGSGFYHSDDLLEGTITLENDSTSLSVDGRIGEFSRGLQPGAEIDAEYESVTFRDVSGGADVWYEILPVLSIDGSFDVAYGAQTLTAQTPSIVSELSIAPRARLTLGLDRLALSLATGYEFLSTGPGSSVDHRISAGFAASYELPTDLRFFLDAGLFWSPVAAALFPDITAGAEGRVGTTLQFRTTAGYEVRETRYREVWIDSPLVALEGRPGVEYGWSWNGTVQVRPISTLLITTNVDFTWFDGVIDPAASPDPVTGLFAATFRPVATLDTDVLISWDISRVFGIDFGWSGAFIDRTTHEPVQVFSLLFGAEDPTERFGAWLDTEWELDPALTIPMLGLGGFYRISESVQFQLDVRDVLSPIYPSGREDWAPYIRPGLNAMLLTKISL